MSLVPKPSTEDGAAPELMNDFDDGDNGDNDDDHGGQVKRKEGGSERGSTGG